MLTAIALSVCSESSNIQYLPNKAKDIEWKVNDLQLWHSGYRGTDLTITAITPSTKKVYVLHTQITVN